MDNIKVIITGTTGMVGKGVLYECLDHPSINTVLVINRQPLGMGHPKLRQIIHKDFHNLSVIENKLTGYDACFFCLGVSAVGMKETDYHHVTYDLTINFAQTLLRLNPAMTFCYVSGQGTDSSEKGRMMWARVKGKTENKLLSLGFKDAYMFRPGYIQPMRGIKSRTRLYNALYVVVKPFYPLMKKLFPNSLNTNATIGKAMIRVALEGSPKKVLHPADINSLARE